MFCSTLDLDSDNIYLNSLDYVSRSRNIDIVFLFLFFCFFFFYPLTQFSKLNEHALISDVQQVDWPELFHGMDNKNNDISSCFITQSSEIINSHVCTQSLRHFFTFALIRSSCLFCVSISFPMSIAIDFKLPTMFET